MCFAYNRKIFNSRDFYSFADSLVVHGHLQFPVTRTSTNLATVTMDTRASRKMLKLKFKSFFMKLKIRIKNKFSKQIIKFLQNVFKF
jgi:hypothetical protein